MSIVVMYNYVSPTVYFTYLAHFFPLTCGAGKAVLTWVFNLAFFLSPGLCL